VGKGALRAVPTIIFRSGDLVGSHRNIHCALRALPHPTNPSSPMRIRIAIAFDSLAPASPPPAGEKIGPATTQWSLKHRRFSSPQGSTPSGQVGEQFRVEFSPLNPADNFFQIDGGDVSLQPAADHRRAIASFGGLPHNVNTGVMPSGRRASAAR